MDATGHECSVCMEIIAGQSEINIIDGDPVCDDCTQDQIIPRFYEAADFEHSWPVRWGRGALRAQDFEAELGPDFVARYQRCEQEYQTLPKLRVYCKHKILASRAPPARGLPALPGPERAALRPWRIQFDQRSGIALVECGAMVTLKSTEHGTEMKDLKECWSCGGVVYPCNGEGAWENSLIPHRCPEDDENDAFVTDDMVRGRDYQKCPSFNCSRVLLLRDGCNHIQCLCGTGFCFLCGQGPLQDDDDHWVLGKPCPRYNKPGESNAVYDGIAEEEVPPEVLQHEAEQRAANEAAFSAQAEREAALEAEGIILQQQYDQLQQEEANPEREVERLSEQERLARENEWHRQEIARIEQEIQREGDWRRFQQAMHRAVGLAIAGAVDDLI